jgi:Tfp pilus assembly protein PilF
VHNYFVAGEPIFLSAHGGLNFWVGNNPKATGYPAMPPGLHHASQEGMFKDSLQVPEALTGHPMSRAEVSRFWSAKANAYIHEHPREWLGLMGRKIKNLWNQAQYDDLSIIAGLQEGGVTTPGLRFGWVAIFAIPGMVLAWRRHPRSRWIVAATGLYMAALLPVFVTERYRLAAVPGLLLLAACGLAELWDALAARRWLRAGVWLGVGAAAYFWVTLPQQELALEWLDAYNTGLKALESGDLAAARTKLERAIACVPGDAEINATMGGYWLRMGDLRLARMYLQRALELDPETLPALNNLALLEMTEGHWDSARSHLATALKMEPEDANLLYLAARCDEKLGRLESAKAEVEKALAAHPDRPDFQQLHQRLLRATPLLNPSSSPQ